MAWRVDRFSWTIFVFILKIIKLYIYIYILHLTFKKYSIKIKRMNSIR